MEGVDSAKLQWSYSDSTSKPYVASYQVWMHDGDVTNAKVVATVAGKNRSSQVITDLPTSETVYFQVVAFGYTSQSPASDAVSLAVPAPPNEPPTVSMEDFPLTCDEGATVNFMASATDNSAVSYMRVKIYAENAVQKAVFSDTYASATATLSDSLSLSGYAAGKYTYSITAVDDEGLSVTKVQPFTIKGSEDPEIVVVSPASGSFEPGDSIEIRWFSSNIPAGATVKIALRRDSSGYLSYPDNANWYRFTDDSSVSDRNDGLEIVTVPSTLPPANDWHIYVVRSGDEAAYTPSERLTISKVVPFQTSLYFPFTARGRPR